jgi:hypothetical protein
MTASETWREQILSTPSREIGLIGKRPSSESTFTLQVLIGGSYDQGQLVDVHAQCDPDLCASTRPCGTEIRPKLSACLSDDPLGLDETSISLNGPKGAINPKVVAAIRRFGIDLNKDVRAIVKMNLNGQIVFSYMHRRNLASHHGKDGIQL